MGGRLRGFPEREGGTEPPPCPRWTDGMDDLRIHFISVNNGHIQFAAIPGKLCFFLGVG